MSKVNALYHIVFCTKCRKRTIPQEHAEHLYRFLWKKIGENKCFLYRINGMPDHVHLLINLHPTVALANLVRDLKSLSSGWMRSDQRFYDFDSWGKEYFAATIAYKDRDMVIEYIKGQKQHHSSRGVEEEMNLLLKDEGMVRFDGEFE